MMSHVFRGRTLTEARHAAESELGPEVVILERRRVKRKGIGGLLGATEFEVEAGLPVAEPDLAEAARARRVPGYGDAAASELRAPFPPPLFAPGVYDQPGQPSRARASLADIARVEQEVRAVRAILYRMSSQPDRLGAELASLRRAVDEMAPQGATPPRLARLIQASGIDGAAARALIGRLRDHGGDDQSLLDAYRDALADLVKVEPWPLATEGRKVIALVGPPGVGKTTTAAKIAAHAIAHEGKTVTFVACDTYRVGAVEQLGNYARLLGSACELARTQQELHRAVSGASTDLVVVDTAGRGPTDDRSVEAGLGAAARGRKTGWEQRERHVILCLEASVRFTDVDRVRERYGVCAPTAIAVTKLDLTAAPGGLVHGTVCTELPVSVLCHGQRVPEDITAATAGRILDYLAPRGKLSN
jgi:flagellar biosynthesis protein FlhF